MFGCIAFMKIPAVHVKKLDDRSRRVIYLGREPGTKSSRLFDPMSGNVLVSRDVVYQEKEFWSWESESSEGVMIPGEFTAFADIEDKRAGSTIEEPRTPPATNGADNIESSAENSGEETGCEPRKFRTLDELYNETEVIEMLDELMVLKVEEPASYNEAAKEPVWQEAMKVEFEAIEKIRPGCLLICHQVKSP